MKFALKSFNSIALAGLLATVGAGTVMAQATAPAAPASAAASGYAGHHGGGHKMGGHDAAKMERHDPAKMQARIAQHQAELKAKLKITAAQEAAWSRFTAALQPPVHDARPMSEQRAELDKLPTPERIDKMQALRKQRMSEMSAAMDKRGEATKAFYAALTPQQQKTFDAEHPRHGAHEGRHHGGMQPKN